MKPLRPGGEGDELLAAQPQLVTYSELQEDPEAFRDQLIRVSGTLLRVPPAGCLPNSGPAIDWALIAEELRLDAVGFERIIRLLPDGLPMTLDGFFRLYEGPLGCGKGAPDGSAWFLEAIRIVQPNPLVSNGRPIGGNIIAGTATPGGPMATPGGSVTPTIQPTPPGTGTPGIVPTTTPTGQTPGLPTATATQAGGTPPVTSIPTASATAQFTPTPTPTPNPLPGTPTVPPGPTGTNVPGATLVPTPTPTSAGTSAPRTPTPTPTVGGYPPPSLTTTPGYP